MTDEDLTPTPIAPRDADGLRCSVIVLWESAGEEDEFQEFRGVLRWEPTNSSLIFVHDHGEFAVSDNAAARLKRLHPDAEAAKDVDVILTMFGAGGPMPPREGSADTDLNARRAQE